MKFTLHIVFYLMAFSGQAIADNQMFSCNMKGDFQIHLIFSSATKNAELVLNTSSVKGKMSNNDHHYHFAFPKTKTRHETHIDINRYNGKMEWEIGAPPFGSYNMDNILDTGTCTKSNVKKAL